MPSLPLPSLFIFSFISIGRAIRHKNDYATIILLDHRFNTNSRIKQKLPNWINKSVVECKKFGLSIGKISNFFKSKEL